MRKRKRVHEPWPPRWMLVHSAEIVANISACEVLKRLLDDGYKHITITFLTLNSKNVKQFESFSSPCTKSVRYLENHSVDRWRMSLVDYFALVLYCTVICTASRWDAVSVHQDCSGEAMREQIGRVSYQETFTQIQWADLNLEKVQYISVLLESQ